MHKDGIDKFEELDQFIENNKDHLLPGIRFGLMLNEDQELCLYFEVEGLTPEILQNIRDFVAKSRAKGFNLGVPIIVERGPTFFLESK